MTIYLTGGAGNRNIGDELMVRGWLEHIAAATRDPDVWFDGNSAEMSSEIFGAAFPFAMHDNPLGRLKRLGPKGFFASLKRGLDFFDNGGFSRHPAFESAAKRFERIEVFHLHGGGYLNSIWPQNAFLMGVGAALKRRTGCRLFGTGIGLLPLPDVPEAHRQLFETVIAAFDLIEFRDAASCDYVRRWTDPGNLVSGLDDTFLIADPRAPRVGGRALHVSYFRGADQFDKVKEILLSPFAQSFGSILFWHAASGDIALADELRALGVRLEVVPAAALVLRGLPVVEGDAMITARFHPHLLGARLGAIGAFRTDGAYYAVKHGSIVGLGSPFFDMAGLSAGEVVARLEAAPRLAPSRIEIEQRVHVAAKRAIAERIYGPARQAAVAAAR